MIKKFGLYMKYDKLYSLAKGISFYDFLTKSDSLTSVYNILYRGYESNGLEDNVFMTDYIGHARQYGDKVNGIIYNETDVLYFNDDVFNELRKHCRLFDKNNIKKIYNKFFESVKLFNAMDGKFHTENKVINFVYNFLKSEKPYSEISKTKTNDLLVPIMMYYSEKNQKNIISFLGGDYIEYGGAYEYVVNDISRYTTLKQIWEETNT